MSATFETATESQTLTGLLTDIASRGDKTALVEFERKEVRSTSYAELGEQVRRLAAGLRSEQGESNSHTAVMAPLRREWIVAALATIGSGRILVPLDVQLS